MARVMRAVLVPPPYERPAFRSELRKTIARYVSRPPVTDERLSFTNQGRVRLELKRPAHDGATALVFDGPELIERLAALVVENPPFLPQSDPESPQETAKAEGVPSA